jgi:pyrroline-5-carboxylate reductase
MCEENDTITPMDETIAFLGAGVIAEVWMERLIRSGSAAPERIMACDVRPERLRELRAKWGVPVGGDNIEGARFAEVVVLAAPPGDTLPILDHVRAELRSGRLLISLAAGVPLALLEARAGEAAVARVMPNIPSLIGEGMNLVAYGRRVSEEQRRWVTTLLELFGQSFVVPDDEMDRWAALCAVGPTYIFPIIEALASAAAAKGLPPERTLFAAAEVVAGAARMMQSGERSPDELKQLISLRTLAEEEAATLFRRVYEEAAAKLEALTRRIGSAVGQV